MKKNEKLLIMKISKRNDRGKLVELTEYFAVSNIYDVDFWVNAHKKAGWTVIEYTVKDIIRKC